MKANTEIMLGWCLTFDTLYTLMNDRFVVIRTTNNIGITTFQGKWFLLICFFFIKGWTQYELMSSKKMCDRFHRSFFPISRYVEKIFKVLTFN